MFQQKRALLKLASEKLNIMYGNLQQTNLPIIATFSEISKVYSARISKHLNEKKGYFKK